MLPFTVDLDSSHKKVRTQTGAYWVASCSFNPVVVFEWAKQKGKYSFLSMFQQIFYHISIKTSMSRQGKFNAI